MDMLNSIAINISPPQRTFICSFTQGYLTDLLMEYILTESIRSELLISSVLKSQRLREHRQERVCALQGSERHKNIRNILILILFSHRRVVLKAIISKNL